MARNPRRGMILNGLLRFRSAAVSAASGEQDVRAAGWLCMVVAMVLAMAADVPGQVAKQPGGPAKAADEGLIENTVLPTDRGTSKKLTEAIKLLAENRFGEAIRNLCAILEGPEDFFFQPDRNSPIHRGLKAEAQRLIGRMPREGRDLYELEYGTRARLMLGKALETGEAARLAEVSRRFFHTRAGYQATFLLGLYRFDHGQPLAGALVLRRLREAGEPADEFEPALSLTIAACWLQAGMPEKARQSLVALRDRNPKLHVTVAGREVPLFNDNAKAVEWLSGLIGPAAAAGPAEADHWLMFRGNAARNAPSGSGPPLLNMRWRVPVADDPFAERVLEHHQRLLSEYGGDSAIPSLHPLAIGDVLLMRTLRSLLAVDFVTGKRLWESPVDELAESTPDSSDRNAQRNQMRQAAGGVKQRMWGDLTYGTLSSDGRLVFSIEDSGSDFGKTSHTAAQGWAMRLSGWRVAISGGRQKYRCNRLVAHDIRTGELKWELGGPAGMRAPWQANTFFLGPPLPMMGQLYVLAEVNVEVRLLALEAATGELAWSQPLVLPERSILLDPMRRWAGMSPSYADGVLVCPTSTGAVVGVELATRSLLWGYFYSQNYPGRGRRRGGGIVIFGGGNVVVAPDDGADKPSTARWIDGSVSIGQGCAIVTPVESDWLYCLSLIDGELLWKCPRQDDLYVACVDRDKIVLVGRRAVRALRLADGQPAWDGRTVSLPDGSTPSGRGFLIRSAAASGGQDARAPGGGRYFLPLSSAEVIGIDLAEGKIVQVSKSRKGNVPGNLICHRGKIISQATEGVDSYSQLDAATAEAERLLTANPDDAEALVLRGEVLLNAGKCSEAIASFRRAYELDPDPRTRKLLRELLLEGLRTEFAAYCGRGAEIERLLDDPSQRAAFLRLMAGGLREAGELASALEYCGKLIDLQPDQRQLDQVDKALIVRRDRWVQGQLAELREEAKGETAAKIDHLVRRLSSGGQPLETEPAVPQQGDAAEQDADWPVGKVEVATAPTKKPKNIARRGSSSRGRILVVIMEMLGSPGPFFRDLSIQYQYDKKHDEEAIVAYDGLGHERWQVSLSKSKQKQGSRRNSDLFRARASGRLLLVSLDWEIFAIDALGSGPNDGPRVLWTQDLTDLNADSADRPLPPQLAVDPWPQLQNELIDINNRLNILGPVGNHYVCFQRLRNLMAVDPRSGETLWVRQDLPFDCHLFGDDRYVFALPPDRDEAVVLRAVDGELVGARKVPRVAGQRFKDSCLATLGRNLLLWRPEGDQLVLGLFDPLEGRDIWPPRKFAAGSKASVVEEKAVGVMEPSGRFVLVSLSDGQVIADMKLEAESSLGKITLFESGGQYFLLTDVHPPLNINNRNRNNPQFVVNNQIIRPLPGCRQSKPIGRGRLYAFDQEGKLSWPAPVEIKNQWMLSHQPASLPVLTFVCQVQERKNPKGSRHRKTLVLCIDKRNGRTAYEAEFSKSPDFLQVTGDAEKKTVDLTMQQNTIILTFTDTPLPPPSATDAVPAKSSPGGKVVCAPWNPLVSTRSVRTRKPGTELF